MAPHWQAHYSHSGCPHRANYRSRKAHVDGGHCNRADSSASCRKLGERNIACLCTKSLVDTVPRQACYLVYKKYEPETTILHLLLLVVAPAAVAIATRNEITVFCILGSMVAYWSFVAFFTLLYRLSPFHPLANYPGPLAARVSKLYHVRVASRGNAHWVIKGWHDRYGDVVRVGESPILMFTSRTSPPLTGPAGSQPKVRTSCRSGERMRYTRFMGHGSSRRDLVSRGYESTRPIADTDPYR